MDKQFRMLPGGREDEDRTPDSITAEKMLLHFRNINSSLLQDALDTWGDIWDEFQGNITHGVMVVPEAEKSFRPSCGWPEFLEKMWLLRHYLDAAKRFSDGKR